MIVHTADLAVGLSELNYFLAGLDVPRDNRRRLTRAHHHVEEAVIDSGGDRRLVGELPLL